MAYNNLKTEDCEAEKMALLLYYQNIQNKVLKYKSNLHSIANIADSNPAGAWMFVLTDIMCCQVHMSAIGRSQVQMRSTACVLVFVCVLV
jgi:hypothetical protein